MSELSSEEARQQIMQLRELTRITGALHEAQILQLKGWPKVLFGVESTSKATVDIAGKRIDFDIVAEKKSVLKDASALLEQWTMALLGEDWRVTIHVGYRKVRRQATGKLDAKGTSKP